MKLSLLGVFLFTFTLNSFSQSKEFQFKIVDYKSDTGEDAGILSISKNDKNQLVILKKEVISGPGGWTYFIEIRDENLKKIKSINISSKVDGDNYIIEKIIKVENKVILFSSKLKEKEKTEIYYYQNFDINTQKVSARKEFYKVTYEKKRRRATLDISASKNEKHILLVVYPPYVKKVTSEQSFFMLNPNLDVIWEKKGERTVVDNNKDARTNFYQNYSTQYIIGNKGSVYSITFDEGESKLLKYDGSDLIKTKIVLSGTDMFNLSLSLSLEGNPIVSGYYSDKGTQGVKGSFFIVYDKEQLDENNNVKTNFNKDMVQYGMSIKKKEKSDKKEKRKEYKFGTSSLTIDDLVFDDNGNIYLIGSQFHVEAHTHTNSEGRTYTTYTYHYEDIYVSKFTKDGEHIYDAKVPKNNVYGTTVNSPYQWFIHNDKISFCFLDNKENTPASIKVEGIRKAGKSKSNVYRAATVDEGGKVNREVLYDYVVAKNKKFIFYSSINKITENFSLVYLGKKQWKLFKLFGN